MQFDLHFNVLKSDGGLSQAQQAHTDELPPFSLGTTTKYSHFVTLTRIEKETLFYIQPMGIERILILIERDDTLLFRNDIPHSGAKNLTDNLNCRLYSFLTIDK